MIFGPKVQNNKLNACLSFLCCLGQIYHTLKIKFANYTTLSKKLDRSIYVKTSFISELTAVRKKARCEYYVQQYIVLASHNRIIHNMHDICGYYEYTRQSSQSKQICFTYNSMPLCIAECVEMISKGVFLQLCVFFNLSKFRYSEKATKSTKKISGISTLF